jgi:hypothetical protein
MWHRAEVLPCLALARSVQMYCRGCGGSSKSALYQAHHLPAAVSMLHVICTFSFQLRARRKRWSLGRWVPVRAWHSSQTKHALLGPALVSRIRQANSISYHQRIRWAHYFRYPSLARWEALQRQPLLGARSASPPAQVKSTLWPTCCPFAYHRCSASLAFKSCNCNSSIATRVGFSVWCPKVSSRKPSLTLNSTLAHLRIELFTGLASSPALGHQTD